MKNTSCLRVTLAILTVAGAWYPPAYDRGRLGRYLCYVYTVAYQALVYFPVIGAEIFHLYSVLGDLSEMLSISLLMLSHFTLAPKVYIIWRRQWKIKSFLRLLDSDKFTRKDPIKKAIIEKTTNFAYLVSIVFAIMVLLTCGLWFLIPMFTSTSEMPLVYPKINSKAWFYIPMYIYQMITLTLVAMSAAAADLLVGGAMALATAELDLLFYELTHIGDNGHVISRASLNVGRCRDDEQDDEDLYLEAVSCVKFHEDIIRLFEEMQDAFSLPILFQFIASSVIICAIVLKITMSTDLIEIIAMVFYFICINIQLLVLCYFGDMLTFKSQQVPEGAYFSNWVGMSLRTRKAILMIIVRAQRPLVMTAGNIFNVTLTTFTTVLRTSYSYFAVLNQRPLEE